jgi:hypothetical protein
MNLDVSAGDIVRVVADLLESPPRARELLIDTGVAAKLAEGRLADKFAHDRIGTNKFLHQRPTARGRNCGGFDARRYASAADLGHSDSDLQSGLPSARALGPDMQRMTVVHAVHVHRYVRLRLEGRL